MKKKLKNLWYFVLWLVADIKFMHVLIITNIIILGVAWWLPDNIGRYLFAYVLISYIIVASNFCFIMPLRYSYKKFKAEQKEMFDTIKDSDN